MTIRRARLFLLPIVLLISLLAALALAGCGAPAAGPEANPPEMGEDDEPLPPPPDGAVVYANNCAGCHGEDGAGTEKGPAVKPADKSADELFTVIAEGRPGTSMPGFRGVIGEGEVDAVIQYLRGE